MKQLTHQGNVVVTTALLAQSLGTEEKALTQNYSNNKDRYKEGIHFQVLKGKELKEFLLQVENFDLQISSKTRQLYLWTEKGAFNHVKSLGTDQAWDAYQNLVETYFRVREVAESRPVAILDMLSLMIQQAKEQESRLFGVEEDIRLLKAQSHLPPESYTIIGYASLHKIEVGLKLASNLGRKASVICKAKGIRTEEIPDRRYGRVKVYPLPVLEEVFNQSIV